MSEFEVWQGLANLYASLSYWRDAEICLQKAKTLKSFSAITLHAEGEELSQYAKMLCLLPFGIFMQCRLSIYKLRSWKTISSPYFPRISCCHCDSLISIQVTRVRCVSRHRTHWLHTSMRSRPRWSTYHQRYPSAPSCPNKAPSISPSQGASSRTP